MGTISTNLKYNANSHYTGTEEYRGWDMEYIFNYVNPEEPDLTIAGRNIIVVN